MFGAVCMESLLLKMNTGHSTALDMYIINFVFQSIVYATIFVFYKKIYPSKSKLVHVYKKPNPHKVEIIENHTTDQNLGHVTRGA
jgi:archaellum component FlaF (FlaF/FlaG flagellin family)